MKIMYVLGLAVVALLFQPVQSWAANVASGKSYQLSFTPYFDESPAWHKDNTGPQPFVDKKTWYRGELTNGVYTTADYFGDCVHETQQGPVSIIVDLRGVYSVTSAKLQACGGGVYGGLYYPQKIEVYGLQTPGASMPFDQFVATMDSDNQNWTKLGELVTNEVENGNAVIKNFEITFSAANCRLIKFVLTDKLSTTSSMNLGEVEVYSTSTPTLDPSNTVLVTFPGGGRNAYFPINIDVFNKCQDRRSFIIGNSADMSDTPFGAMAATAGMIKDTPLSMRSKGVDILNAMGTTTLRFWDNIWVNYRSDIERIKVINWCTGTGYSLPASDSSDPFPDYKEIIDFCAENNWVCVMVLDTFYYDPASDKIYTTPEICRNNPDDHSDPYYTTNPDDPCGILYKAIARNVTPIAQYYKNKGYTTGLILEIGNESIGYVHDYTKPDYVLLPSLTEHARLVNAYARAVKAVSADIGTAIYPWPTEAVFGEVAKLGAAKFVDYCVTHHYAPRFNPGSLLQDETAVADALDAAGMGHVKLLLTEYNLDLYNAGAGAYSTAVQQLVTEMAMVSHPRIAGMHEFCLFQNAKMAWSNGSGNPVGTGTWTLRRYGEDANRPHDYTGLRWRYITLPSGMTQTLLSKAVKGTLIKYWPGTNANIGGLMFQEGNTRRVFLVNPTTAAMPLQWNRTPTIIKQSVLTSTDEYFNNTTTTPLIQPWSIAESTPTSLPASIPAKSAMLIELSMPSFNVQHNGTILPDGTGALDFGTVRMQHPSDVSLDIVNTGDSDVSLVDTSAAIFDERFTAPTLDPNLWDQIGGGYTLAYGAMTLTTDATKSQGSIKCKKSVKLLPGGKVIVRSDALEMQEWALGAVLCLMNENTSDRIGLTIDALNGPTKLCVVMNAGGQSTQLLDTGHGPQYMEGGWTITWQADRVKFESDIWGTIFDSAISAVDKDGVAWRIPAPGTAMYFSCCSGYNSGNWFTLNNLRLTTLNKVSFDSQDGGVFFLAAEPPVTIATSASAPLALDIDPEAAASYQDRLNIFTNLGSYSVSLQAKGTFESDLTLDGAVDFNDLELFTSHWLDPGANTSDFDENNIVNIKDLSVLAADWLAQTEWY